MRVAAALDAEFGALVLPADPGERETFLEDHGEEIRVAVCSGRIGVDTELMRRLPALEGIVSFGVGYDSTDVGQAADLAQEALLEALKQ